MYGHYVVECVCAFVYARLSAGEGLPPFPRVPARAWLGKAGGEAAARACLPGAFPCCLPRLGRRAWRVFVCPYFFGTVAKVGLSLWSKAADLLNVMNLSRIGFRFAAKRRFS